MKNKLSILFISIFLLSFTSALYPCQNRTFFPLNDDMLNYTDYYISNNISEFIINFTNESLNIKMPCDAPIQNFIVHTSGFSDKEIPQPTATSGSGGGSRGTGSINPIVNASYDIYALNNTNKIIYNQTTNNPIFPKEEKSNWDLGAIIILIIILLILLFFLIKKMLQDSQPTKSLDDEE